jgi:hypothetical protein
MLNAIGIRAAVWAAVIFNLIHWFSAFSIPSRMITGAHHNGPAPSGFDCAFRILSRKMALDGQTYTGRPPVGMG